MRPAGSIVSFVKLWPSHLTQYLVLQVLLLFLTVLSTTISSLPTFLLWKIFYD